MEKWTAEQYAALTLKDGFRIMKDRKRRDISYDLKE